MDASELLETITQLIHQAQEGEIDPWDVQVIEVIDRYLELMAPQERPRSYETDLSQSGQAFLSASMLVLFKANTLMQMQVTNDQEEALLDDVLPESEDGLLLYQSARLPLERHLKRRPSAMPPKKRPVTLHELIEQLQIMASQLKLVQKDPKAPRPRRQPTVRTMKAALELAHQENLTEVAGELEQVLYNSAIELQLEHNWMNLEQLVQLWTQAKQPHLHSSGDHSPNSNTVSVFWALLLLSAQSKVELYQDDFYQDVKIRLLSNSNDTSKQLDTSIS
ncbi:MAG: ScpA family protein [Cyanobacteria bacterium P01_A01_bin.45]